MKVYGIECRKADAWMVKFPQLRKLEIGESVDRPKLLTRPKPHTQFYQMAATIGIRVSTRSIDANTMRDVPLEKILGKTPSDIWAAFDADGRCSARPFFVSSPIP